MDLLPQFLPALPDSNLLYIGFYSPTWVIISILLAILGSYSAQCASARIVLMHNTASRLIWASVSALTMGVGIWAMHFIGMLALNLPCRVSYDPLMTLASMIPGILSAGLALGVVLHGTKYLSPLIGSVLLGAGIGTMHYTGMAAMQLEGFVRYDPSLFALSIVVAIVLSYIALRIKNGSFRLKKGHDVLVAVVMGTAISGMHYTAMGAAYFVRGDAAALPPSFFTTNTLAIVITITTAFIALSALAITTVSRYFEKTEQLHNSEVRFANIINLAADAIISVGEDQRILIFNHGAEQIFGYTAAEMLGQPLVRLLPERYHEAHPGHLRQFGAAQKTAQQMSKWPDISGQRKDGSEFFVEANISQMMENEKQIFTVILRDISARKQAEEKIRQLNRNLERRVLARTTELRAANKELEAFSYSVSHDLRAPLRSIDGFSQALLEDYADKLDNQGRDYLNRVRTATQRMGHLIDDILTLSRVTRAEIRRETVDLSALAADVLAELQKSEPERKIDWHIESGLVAEGDANLLRVVLGNLLGNAWKFTGKTANAKIEFGALRNAQGEPSFFLRDNGAGYDMRYADKLFGAFQRLHLVSDFPGTGIGLATVQRIVHCHGGRVWAEGAEGKGATFYFTL